LDTGTVVEMRFGTDVLAFAVDMEWKWRVWHNCKRRKVWWSFDVVVVVVVAGAGAAGAGAGAGAGAVVVVVAVVATVDLS